MSGEALRRVTVSASGAAPFGLTIAATIITGCAPVVGRAPSTSSRVCPVVSSVCQDWLWKARKMPTQRDCAGNRSRSPPSCHTPSSPLNRRLLPWFMWTSCTPLPGRKPNTLSLTAGSGPKREPKTYARDSGSATARWT